MITHSKEMVILTAIKIFLKLCLAWFGIVAVMQNVIANDIFEQLMAKMPAQVGLFFGFIYLVFIVVRKGHDTYTHIHLNKMKIKRERERLEQDRIHTKKDEQELKD